MHNFLFLILDCIIIFVPLRLRKILNVSQKDEHPSNGTRRKQACGISSWGIRCFRQHYPSWNQGDEKHVKKLPGVLYGCKSVGLFAFYPPPGV